VLATITLVPVIVTVARLDWPALRKLALVRVAEAVGLAFALVVAGLLVFDFDPAVAPSVPLYMTVPFLVWAALRFGPLGASASFAMIAFLTIWGAAHGRGPFTGGEPNENALTVQLFLTLVGMATLTLAAFLKERHRAQAALRESEAHFRNIANTAPVMIWIMDADQRFMFFNKRWLDFTGRSLGEEVGASALNGAHPDDPERGRNAYAAAFAAKRAFDLEYRHLRQDGVYRWIVDSGVPRFDGGRFLGYIGSRMDITERHDLQRGRQELAHIARLSSMGELAASLAHELNQPLTAILTNVHAALRMTAAERIDMQEIRAILQDVVDDNASVRRALQRLLRTLGMDADPFATGDELLELLDAMPSYSPDCVILDVQLPGSNGPEIQRRLAGRALPVIVITAYDELAVREQALSAGAVAFLRKPFSDELLLRTLRAALGSDPAGA